MPSRLDSSDTAVLSHLQNSQSTTVKHRRSATTNGTLSFYQATRLFCMLLIDMFGVRSIAISMSVCLFNCLSVCLLISKTTGLFSLNFLYMLPMTVARSSSDGNAICDVFPVLLRTSCFDITHGIGQNQRRRVCFVQFARWRHQGREKSAVSDCILLN